MVTHGKPIYITASGQVVGATAAVPVAGSVAGLIVSAHSSGTLKLEDSVGGGQNLLVDTYTFPAGSSIIAFPRSIPFVNGLYATFGGSGNKVSVILDA